MHFDSSVIVIGRFPAFSPAIIRTEISQARVGIDAAKQAGPAHRAFIDALPEAWRRDSSTEIFSRVLWLKSGWYPLAPYYHLDWYSGPRCPQVETILTLAGDASRTEFVLGPIELPEVEPEESQMKSWSEQVADGVDTERLKTYTLEPEKLVWFDNRTWHRARPARKQGWRLLMRAIRGLSREDSEGAGYPNSGRFTTVRNGFVPETAEEKLRYQPYRI